MSGFPAILIFQSRTLFGVLAKCFLNGVKCWHESARFHHITSHQSRVEICSEATGVSPSSRIILTSPSATLSSNHNLSPVSLPPLSLPPVSVSQHSPFQHPTSLQLHLACRFPGLCMYCTCCSSVFHFPSIQTCSSRSFEINLALRMHPRMGYGLWQKHIDKKHTDLVLQHIRFYHILPFPQLQCPANLRSYFFIRHLCIDQGHLKLSSCVIW